MLKKLAPASKNKNTDHFGIVVSQYNIRYTDGLLENALKELKRLAPSSSVEVVKVPGGFEIPVTVQAMVHRKRHKKLQAVIALGVILEGKTSHAAAIGTAITNALQQIAIDSQIPVIHQVLGVSSEAQARVRCLETKFNRGIEAARTAVRMAEVMRELGTDTPRQR